MKQRPIGYYVHHHGAGHRARAQAIAGAIDWPIVLMGTGIGGIGIDLPDDRPASGRFDGRDEAECRPDALHYAPLDHDGVRARVARMAGWIAAEKPALMVVDVSAEVAMLARLASVPTVCIRINGARNDSAHLDMFRGASALLAPFHSALDASESPEWVRAKTSYFPGIVAAPVIEKAVDRRVLVVFGRGGPPGNGAVLADAARACPDWDWRVIGPADGQEDIPANLSFVGWVPSPEHEIARASVVVGAAGDGLVGAALAANRPLVCIPQDRPFGEQRATAEGLRALGAAVVVPDWPPGPQWPALLGQALAQSPHSRLALHDPRGLRKVTSWLAAQARGFADLQDHAA